MKHLHILFLLLLSCAGFHRAAAQEAEKQNPLNNLKISGYAQFQYLMTEVEREWPGSYVSIAGESFTHSMKSRFQVRRGYLKFAYQNGPVTLVFLPDLTDRGVGLKDAYAELSTRNKMLGFRIGAFSQPFGYEVDGSSSTRESAERSRIVNALFPGATDIGAMVMLTGAKNSFMSRFNLEAGVFNGNGMSTETDSYKDFVGSLKWTEALCGSTELGMAVSYYRGTIYGGEKPTMNHTRYVYRRDQGFAPLVTDKTHAREYFGLGVKLLHDWGCVGKTGLISEWITGQQPSAENRFARSRGMGFNGADELYIRNFQAVFAMLTHNIAHSKHTVMVKYDYFDPNTRAKGNSIGMAAAGFAAATHADIAYTSVSVGYIYDMSRIVRLMAQYDFTSNERSLNLSGFAPGDKIRQDILTLRLQVRIP